MRYILNIILVVILVIALLIFDFNLVRTIKQIKLYIQNPEGYNLFRRHYYFHLYNN